MLTVKNVYKTYKIKGGALVKALDDVSIEFADKGMVFLLGRSGSGKSTLLNVAGGLDKPDGGEIIVKGRSSKEFSSEDFDGYRNTYVGFIFQEYNILNEFNVEQNIALALQLQGKKDTTAAVEGVLGLVDLAGMGKRKPKTLSGGQKQRVAIARALVKNPAIIFADEPTGALDSETGEDVLNTLKKLSSERLVIVVSHDRDFANKYGDRIIEMKDGKIIADTNKSSAYIAAEISDVIKTKADGGREAKFIKSRLPLTRSIKMGAGSIKRHPVRFAFTLFLATVSFAIFGILSTMMTYNIDYTVVSAVNSSHYTSALMHKNSWYDYTRIYSDHTMSESKTFFGEGTTPAVFGRAEIAKINSASASTGLDFAGVFKMKYQNGDAADETIINNINYDLSINKMADFYKRTISWFADCGEEYLRRNFGNDCLIAGSYPTGPDEIALSEYHFSLFQKYGYYYTFYDGHRYNVQDYVITDPTDLIGKVMNLNNVEITITGFYRVGAVDPAYDVLKEINNVLPEEQHAYAKFKSEFDNVMQDSFHLTAFVSEAFYDKYGTFNISPEAMDLGNTESFPVYTSFLGDSVSDKITFITSDVIPGIAGVKVLFYGAGKTFLLGDECLIAAGRLLYYMDILSSSVDGSNIEYGQLHPEFMEALSNIRKAASYEPERNYVNESDVRIAIDAINKDFNSRIKNIEADKLYLGNSRQSLKIAGVIFSETYSAANGYYIVTDLDFIRSNADYWRYDKYFKTTAYTEPADARYSSILSPATNKTAQSYYILGMGQRIMGEDASYRWQNKLYDEALSIGSDIEFYSIYFIVTGTIVGVFAALFLANFITASIAGKRSEIGILRALGARGLDVFKIFLSESFIFAGICSALTTITSLAVCTLINTGPLTEIIKFPILNFGVPHALLILAVSLFVSFISTVLPVFFAAKKAPVESIRSL